MRLILASGSPRRKELLAGLVPEFEVMVSDIPENFNDQLTGVGEQVAELAGRKAAAVALGLSGECLVLAADTIVYHQNVKLGKPSDVQDAEAMLRGLSGDWHEVITGIALIKTPADHSQGQTGGTLQQGYAVSRVKMREISPAEIQAYIASGEPMDKAGAYAIQGGAGKFVEQIEGSYENIVGLPLELTRDLLSEMGAFKA